MCDSHRGFQSSQEGGVAVAEPPRRKKDKAPVNRSDLGHLDDEGVDELPAREEPVSTTRQLAHDAAAAVVASKTPAHAPSPLVHDEQDPSQRLLESKGQETGARPAAPVARTQQLTHEAAQATVTASTTPVKPAAVSTPPHPKTTTSPRKDPPKMPAAPAQRPLSVPPAPTKKPEPVPVAQAPVYRPPVQPTETPEARKTRLVTQKLAQICERENRGTFSVMAMHQSLNEFVNLLGTPFVNANAPRNQRMSEESRAKIAVSTALRALKIDEKLWPRFLSR